MIEEIQEDTRYKYNRILDDTRYKYKRILDANTIVEEYKTNIFL